MREKLRNYLLKITKNKIKEDYEFLKDYHESNLSYVKDFLKDFNISNPIKKVIQVIDEELDRRKKISEEFIDKFNKKYFNKYIRYKLNDGLGSYMVLKVSNIGGIHKDYIDLFYSVSVTNIDGEYRIDSYKNGSIKIYSDLEETKIEFITEEEYKKEFSKAVEYYKNLEE